MTPDNLNVSRISRQMWSLPKKGKRKYEENRVKQKLSEKFTSEPKV